MPSFRYIEEELYAGWRRREDGANIAGSDATLGETVGQEVEDNAVETALSELMQKLHAEGRIPQSVHILLCDSPESVHMSLASLVEIERRGYRNSGYEHRAEMESHFERVFRTFAHGEHGPLRFGIIAVEDSCGLRPLAYFDYYRVSEHLKDDDGEDAYAGAAREWEDGHQGLSPQPYIVSKLVADPRIPRALASLPGMAVATTLKALASINGHGIYIEAQAQPATRRFVAHHLGVYILGMEVILDRDIQQSNGGGAPSKLIVYVPSPAVEEDNCGG
jgi:hypothetical protein